MKKWPTLLVVRGLFCSICLQSICQATASRARAQLNSVEEEDEACFKEYGTQDLAAQQKSSLTQDCRRQKSVETTKPEARTLGDSVVYLQISFASLTRHLALFSSFDLGIALSYSRTVNEV